MTVQTIEWFLHPVYRNPKKMGRCATFHPPLWAPEAEYLMGITPPRYPVPAIRYFVEWIPWPVFPFIVIRNEHTQCVECEYEA
jgi:hypothetical protein